MHMLMAGNAGFAAKLFDDQDWTLVALYRNADYQEVIDRLEKPRDAREFYLLANSLTLTDQTEAAIFAYRKVLILSEGSVNQISDDARYNLALLEQSLQPESIEDSENPAGSEDTDESSAENEPAETPSENRSGNQSQTQSGSNIGGNNTLNQSSLQNDSESGEAVNSDESVATDATASLDSTHLASDTDADAGKTKNQVNAETNSNTVLNPYAEQWLRTLPQDPGGYFRRKLSYTTQLRQQANQTPTGVATEKRY